MSVCVSFSFKINNNWCKVVTEKAGCELLDEESLEVQLIQNYYAERTLLSREVNQRLLPLRACISSWKVLGRLLAVVMTYKQHSFWCSDAADSSTIPASGPPLCRLHAWRMRGADDKQNACAISLGLTNRNRPIQTMSSCVFSCCSVGQTGTIVSLCRFCFSVQ